ncbi:hypothetical protein RUND412_010517 [Rhizina undulata]
MSSNTTGWHNPPELASLQPRSASAVSKIHILDLPRELIERILDDLPRPRHLFPLLLTSKTISSFVLPRLYSRVELRSEESIFLSPQVLNCLVLPTSDANLIHTRALSLKGSLKNVLLRLNPNGPAPNSFIQGTCLLLQQIVEKIPVEQLRIFEWNINFCPHPQLLKRLTVRNHGFLKIFMDSPHETKYCECLPLLLTCCSEMRELCFRKISHATQLEQLSQMLNSAEHLFSAWLGLRKRFDPEKRRALRLTPTLIEAIEKRRLKEISLSYMCLPASPEQGMRMFCMENLVSLTLRDCEGDKALLASMRSRKPLRLKEFKLITETAEGIPEFLSAFEGLRLLHMFFLDYNAGAPPVAAALDLAAFEEMIGAAGEDSDEDYEEGAGIPGYLRPLSRIEFGDNLFDSVLRHKSTLETLLIDGQRKDETGRVVLSEEQWGKLREFTKLQELGIPYQFRSGLETYMLPIFLPPTIRYLSLRNGRGVIFNQQSKNHLQYLCNGINDFYRSSPPPSFPPASSPHDIPPKLQKSPTRAQINNRYINPNHIHTLSIGYLGFHNTKFYAFCFEDVKWGPMILEKGGTVPVGEGGGAVRRLGYREVSKREAKAGALPGDVEIFGFWY